MELNVVEEDKNKMKLEVKGETHTFCNLIRDEMWNDSKIKKAGYLLEHPLVSSPVIIIEVNSGDPKKALLDCVERLRKKSEELKSLFKGLK